LRGGGFAPKRLGTPVRLAKKTLSGEKGHRFVKGIL